MVLGRARGFSRAIQSRMSRALAPEEIAGSYKNAFMQPVLVEIYEQR
jgi:hypothetical protein